MKTFLNLLAIASLSLIATTSFAKPAVSCYQSANPKNAISFTEQGTQTSAILVTYKGNVILLKPLSIYVALLSNGSTVSMYGQYGMREPSDAVIIEKAGTVTWNTERAGSIVFDVCK